MRKQISRLKNGFDNLSSLLKDVTKILSIKESKINKCIVCKDDLILLKKQVEESKDKLDRLLELTNERVTIDKNIEASEKEYDSFRKSKEYTIITDTLEKIDHKKNEIANLEMDFTNMVANLSRPITKFSYLASKETQGKLAVLQNESLEIISGGSQYVQLFGEIRRGIIDKSIQIKDPEKTINQIDEIVKSLPLLSSNLKNFQEGLRQLQKSVNLESIRHLDDIKHKVETYEKSRSDNISKIDEIKSSINVLDSSIKILKKKIEQNVSEITHTNYSVV
jgi:hypothetical protein